MIVDALVLASSNAAAFWTVLAEARGYQLTRRPGYLAIHGTERYGLRIMVLSPDLSAADRAELQQTVSRHPSGPIMVEDPFGTVSVDGLTARTLPVMIREPAPVPGPPVDRVITKVSTKEDLATAERIVVEGFTLDNFQPYRPGEVFPPALLDHDAVEVFLLGTAGASFTIVDRGAGRPVVGVYWVTTLPEHRSRGVGRALMLAALNRYADLPMTLTASRAGKPLYDSLGFTTVTEAVWWV